MNCCNACVRARSTFPQQAERALGNFFRKGHLIALRDLALRRTADRVDAQMQAYRSDHAIRPTWPATERNLVCVSPSPLATRLVRATRRMAAGLRAEWMAVYVEVPGQPKVREVDRERVVQTLRLAEQLGARTVTLSGANIGDEILAYARRHNVTKAQCHQDRGGQAHAPPLARLSLWLTAG